MTRSSWGRWGYPPIALVSATFFANVVRTEFKSLLAEGGVSAEGVFYFFSGSLRYYNQQLHLIFVLAQALLRTETLRFARFIKNVPSKLGSSSH